MPDPSPAGAHAHWCRVRDLDGLSIVHVAGGPVAAFRTRQDIARAPRDNYLILMNRDGAMRVAQSGRMAALQTGDLTVVDAAQPFSAVLGEGGGFELLTMSVPRARLHTGRPLTPEASAVRVAAAGSSGQLLAPYFATIAGPDWKSTTLTRRFLDAGLELLASVLEHCAGAAQASPSSAIMNSIERETRQRLADPNLSPADVAAACAVSTRQLHRLFAYRGTTFGAWVRTHRLAGSHRDLVDRGLAHLTIADIGARWGYRSAAHFSRSISERYGVSPSTIRLRSDAVALSRPCER